MEKLDTFVKSLSVEDREEVVQLCEDIIIEYITKKEASRG